MTHLPTALHEMEAHLAAADTDHPPQHMERAWVAVVLGCAVLLMIAVGYGLAAATHAIRAMI